MYNHWAQLNICTRAHVTICARFSGFKFLIYIQAQAIYLELRSDIQAPNFKCESVMQAQLWKKHFQA